MMNTFNTIDAAKFSMQAMRPNNNNKDFSFLFRLKPLSSCNLFVVKEKGLC